jgi:MoxR-vWA-beta-propeller ternary system domain bpX2
MSSAPRLTACRAARVPAAGLDALGPLRARGGVGVVPGDPAWVTWENDRPDLVVALLAVPGAELFEPRDGRWFRPGSPLPAFDVPPAGEPVPLERLLHPAPFAPTEPAAGEPRRLPLRLVRSEVPRPTTAIRCRAADLQAWADAAPAAEITAVKAARCGDVAWLIGNKLPAVAGAERFWGDRVLIPLGYRADPDWPEGALREAAGVGPDEILVLAEYGSEALPADALRPLTRASIRRVV